eukprot:519266_1
MMITTVVFLGCLSWFCKSNILLRQNERCQADNTDHCYNCAAFNYDGNAYDPVSSNHPCYGKMKCTMQNLQKPSTAICVGFAEEGESCMWTSCTKGYYCDGSNCKVKDSSPVKINKGSCLVENESCKLASACVGKNKDPTCNTPSMKFLLTDYCCHPMRCITGGGNSLDGKCQGKSDFTGQCVTTSCKDGLHCGNYYECEHEVNKVKANNV